LHTSQLVTASQSQQKVSSSRLEFFIENFLDSPGDSRVWLVNVFDGELDLLAGVQRRPKGGDGKQPVESYLLVGGRLHVLQSVELGQELLVEAHDRLVVAFLADLIAASEESFRKISRQAKLRLVLLRNVELDAFLAVLARVRIDDFDLFLLLLGFFLGDHHLGGLKVQKLSELCLKTFY
jgi:hypothetical protein